MTQMTKLAISIDDSFPPLPHAPIVEAVINIRARPSVALEEAALKSQLESTLIGYEFLDSLQDFEIRQRFSFQSDVPETPAIRKLDWKGLRFQSLDKKHIVQFSRDEFVFSRLEPYVSWEQLYDEGMRLWSIYVALFQPAAVHRTGLRYINRIQMAPDELRFEDYLQPTPQPPVGLEVPFHGFLYRETLAIPGHSYAVNVIRTIQPPEAPGIQGPGLILDIDAFTTQDFELSEALLARRLLEMRWLKNKVFFGSITPKAKELFQ